LASFTSSQRGERARLSTFKTFTISNPFLLPTQIPKDQMIKLFSSEELIKIITQN